LNIRRLIAGLAARIDENPHAVINWKNQFHDAGSMKRVAANSSSRTMVAQRQEPSNAKDKIPSAPQQ
jgi:hypothetical protein